MWSPRCSSVAAVLAGAALVGFAGASTPHRPAHAPASAPDSVTLRVTFKSLGSWVVQCTGLNWGWDSLTWRLAPGNSVGGDYLLARFTLGRTISPDSAWLIYPYRELGLNGHWTDPVGAPEFDSVVVTTRQTAFTLINVSDVGAWFRVKLVDPWPDPPPIRIKTTTLRGSVVDDSTSCAVPGCQVVVDGTKLSAYTDTLGGFAFEGVPVGEIGLDACAGGYVGKHLEVHAPREPLAIRLRRDPRVTSTGPCRRAQ